jgi:FtsH-binding integral membrane protein
MPTYQDLGYGIGSVARDRTREVFGQVMGLVALTVGCLALGAYTGRNLAGNNAWLFMIASFACVFGLNFAAAKGREQLAIGLLFGMGLLLGLAFAPILTVYAKAEPDVLYQAAGATAGFVGVLGTAGYVTRRDLSSWRRGLFIALLALIAFGLIAMFVAIPHANVIYCVAGLGIFGAFTVFDFNRLKRTSQFGAVPMAASIFLDIFNVFLFMLRLLGGGRR